MPPNNEHMALKTRIERRLGRRVTNAAWNVAERRRFVQDALDASYDAGEDELVEFLDDVLAVFDEGLHSASRAASARTVAAPTRDYAVRLEALSRVAADEAAGDADILAFRRTILRRDTPMSPDEAEAYLEQPTSRRSRGGTADHTELLRYQNRRVSWDLHVAVGSPLDELRKLAVDLSRSYPWEPAQAAPFVLEGLIPLATPFVLRLTQSPHEGRPLRSRVTMEVDLWVPAAGVARAYRRLQRQVLPRHNRPTSRRSIELINFVLQQDRATWTAHMEAWNTEHPDQAFLDYRRFRTAYQRARRSLAEPSYRLYLGGE